MPPSQVNGATHRDTAPGLFDSARHIAIPTTDVVSYAFATYGTYDVDKPIYVEASNEASFISAREARTKVRQLVTGLKKHGLQTGDCVCLVAYNNIFYPLLWLGVIGAGGCVSGTNPSYTVPELQHHFRSTNTKFIISQVEVLVTAVAAGESCGVSASHTFVLGPPDAHLPAGYPSVEVLYEYGESDWGSFDHDEERAENIAVLSATSGTAGLPKSAALSHRYVVAQSAMIQEGIGERAHEVSQLVCLPIWHAFQAQLALVLPLRLGIRTYFARKFSLKDFKKAISEFEITDTAVVPPIVTALVKLPAKDRPLLKSLRYIIYAGAPMSARIQTECYSLLAEDAVVAQCFGATEVGWMTLFGPHERDTSGSVGRLLPNVRMRIVDGEGKSVALDNVSGEAVVCSPSMMSTYLNEPGVTSTAFEAPGFFRTGDRVYMKSGKVFVDGRIKDIIKVNGWQVSPAELEAVIMQHPQVLDAAVVGVNSHNEEGLDESRPRAFIVLKPSPATITGAGDRFATPTRCAATTAEKVQEFVSSRVISYKRLSGGIVFIEKIPTHAHRYPQRSATGKILRRLLVDTGGVAVNEEHAIPNGSTNLSVDVVCTPGVSFESTSSPSTRHVSAHAEECLN